MLTICAPQLSWMMSVCLQQTSLYSYIDLTAGPSLAEPFPMVIASSFLGWAAVLAIVAVGNTIYV